MKKNNKGKLPENGESINKDSQTSAKKNKQGGKNSNFPQEYEEQLSTDIRMKQQPYDKDKKISLRK